MCLFTCYGHSGKTIIAHSSEVLSRTYHVIWTLRHSLVNQSLNVFI